MQAYSDPSRADDCHALPDLELWADQTIEICCRECGEFDIPLEYSDHIEYCPTCGSKHISLHPWKGSTKVCWWYWFCFPGCLPDSIVMGPFKTYDEALADAQGGDI